MLHEDMRLLPFTSTYYQWILVTYLLPTYETFAYTYIHEPSTGNGRALLRGAGDEFHWTFHSTCF